MDEEAALRSVLLPPLCLLLARPIFLLLVDTPCHSSPPPPTYSLLFSTTSFSPEGTGGQLPVCADATPSALGQIACILHSFMYLIALSRLPTPLCPTASRLSRAVSRCVLQKDACRDLDGREILHNRVRVEISSNARRGGGGRGGGGYGGGRG